MAVQSHTNIDIINWHFSLIDDDESYQEAGFLKLGNEMTFKSSQGAKLKPSHRPKSSPTLLRMPGFNLGVNVKISKYLFVSSMFIINAFCCFQEFTPNSIKI